MSIQILISTATIKNPLWPEMIHLAPILFTNYIFELFTLSSQMKIENLVYNSAKKRYFIINATNIIRR